MLLFLFLLLSFALAAGLSRVCPPLAALVGAYDMPDALRHRHKRPTARLGGLAFSLPFFAALVLLSLCEGASADPLYAVLLTGGLFVTAVGVADDVQSLSAAVKLVLLSFPATLPFLLSLFPRENLFFALFSMLFLLTMMNAQNFIDGLDGLSGGLSLIGLFGIFLYALLENESTVAGAALFLITGLLGFLPINLPRARLFMGDTGSLFLGYCEGVLFLSLLTRSISPLLTGSVAVLPPSVTLGAVIQAAPFSLLFAFAVPLGNLLFCVTARLLRGKSPFTADRLHLHHLLSDRGISDQKVLLLLVTGGTLFMLFGVFTALF